MTSSWFFLSTLHVGYLASELSVEVGNFRTRGRVLPYRSRLLILLPTQYLSQCATLTLSGLLCKNVRLCEKRVRVTEEKQMYNKKRKDIELHLTFTNTLLRVQTDITVLI